MTWPQVYDPLNNVYLSTILAALPVVVLLGGLAFLKLQAHIAALLGLVSALVVAVVVFGMPASLAGATAVYGAAYGLLPIGWIILNVIFLYQLTNERGLFAILRGSITTVTTDRRLQLLLVAFCFGAFFEGASGFGTPVAVTGAILIGLGFYTACRLGPVADRQHRARRIRRARDPGHRAAHRHRSGSAEAQRHDRPAASLLLGDRPVLADLGFCRGTRDARGLAGDSRRRRHLRHPPILDVELPRSVARRRRRLDRLAGCAGPLSQILEAARDVAAGRGTRHATPQRRSKPSVASRSFAPGYPGSS